MIVDHEKKYLFIGLPYSGSSVISKELIEHYRGEPLYHKHANIPLLLHEQIDFDWREYFIFAVVRDPVDIALSMYNKLLTNPYNTYSDPAYFSENGGFVSKRAREYHRRVHDEGLSFENYLHEKYKYFPYDSDLSLNAKYLNYTIRFETLSGDFKECLHRIGITPVRDLPVYNRTKKIVPHHEVTAATLKKVFGPFYSLHRQFFDSSIQIGYLQKWYFALVQVLRYRKRLQYDLRQMRSNFSIQDLKNER